MSIPSFGPGAAVLAVDVGGTTTKIAHLSAQGDLGTVERVPTPRGADAAARVIELVAAHAAPGEHIGLAVPGIVDEARGLAVFSENLGWRDVPFAHELRQRTGCPAVLAHDVRAAGEAEFRLGAAKNTVTAAVVTIGTGIAAALRVDSRAFSGGGHAGEIGHAVVDPGGRPCVCGGRGCLETTSSAAAIIRRYAEATGHTPAGAEEVIARAADGDPAAERVWRSALDGLALGLSHLCAAIAPELIVLGGGLSEAGSTLLEPLQRRLDALTPLRRTPLVRATLGHDAGVLGAALAGRSARGE